MRLVLILAIAWLSTVALRVTRLDPSFERSRRHAMSVADFVKSPGPPVVRLVSMEHRLAWSDLVWLSIVQDTGKAEPSWHRVIRWADIGTDLDPLHFTIYHSAAIQLALYGKMVDAADALLQKGWGKLPQRWQLPMLLGYNAYFIRGDAFAGSDYMRAAADTPGSPNFLAALSGRMRYHAGDTEGAIAMLESMLPALEGPARRDAEERILILQSEPILAEYDRACQRTRELTGLIPSPEKLFADGEVSAPPYDLLEAEIEFDESCVARTKMIKVRESEAVKARLGAHKDAAPPPLPPELLLPPSTPDEPKPDE